MNAVSGLSCKWIKLHLRPLNVGLFQRSFTSGSILHQSQAQRKVEVFKTNINYEKVGHGSHPVICLPGALGFIQSDFAPQLAKFNRDQFTVVVWDPPGFGKSRPPDRDFSGGPDYFRRDAILAKALMKKLGFDKFSCLGWSDGGITGLILCSLYPTSLKKFVIWGANAFVNENDKKNTESVKDIDKWSDKMKAPMIEMYGEEYFRRAWSEWAEMYIDLYTRGGDICKNELKNINCPTFILHGAKDPMVGAEHPEYLLKNIKNSRLHVMPDGKHNIHLRYADEFQRLVEDFLNEE